MPNRPDMPQRRLHRLPRAIYAKTEYEFFFTVCARHQGKPFDNPVLAEEVVESLLWTRNAYQWRLFCYCLMPDHLHFVCRLSEEQVRLVNTGAGGEQVEGVLDHLGRFKSYTTNRSWLHGFGGQLWQKSRYDRVFDIEHAFEGIVEYTLNNPVRKELAKEWSDWPYSRIVDPWWE